VCGGYVTNFKWKSFEETTRKRKSETQDVTIDNQNQNQPQTVKMRRSMSESVKFDEAFRQATLSIAGKTSTELAHQNSLLEQGINPNTRTVTLHSIPEKSSPPPVSAPSPTLSTIMKAFTDFQHFNIPSPSNLDLPSPASLSNIGIDSAIEDEGENLIYHNPNPIKRALSLDSTSSLSYIPQYRKDLLNFSESLNSRTSSPLIMGNLQRNAPSPTLANTPQELLKSIDLSPADFNNLFNTFNNYTSNIMSIKDGPAENPWRTLIFPLSLQYPVLFKAIASMSVSHLLQLNKDDHLEKLSHDYMCSSMTELAEGLTNNSIPNEVALATCLVLAITEGWRSGGKSSGIIHLKGARSIMKKLTPQKISNNVELYGFLINTFIYFDVMCRLSNVSLIGDAFDESILTTTDKITSLESVASEGSDDSKSSSSSINSFMRPLVAENFIVSKKITEDKLLIDPLLGIAKSLFLIIGKVATFISKVKKLSKLSLADISTAVKFKTEIESWKPNPSVIRESLMSQDPNNKDDDLASCIATAEAYRFSSLLYLQQVVPEISSQQSTELADKVLMLLASIPTTSKTLILHIFPMLISSCEIEDPSDRTWILERWKVMNEKLWLSNVSQAVEIIKEVWRRKDSLTQGDMNGEKRKEVDGMNDWDLFQSRIDTLVGSRKRSEEGTNDWTHWSTVMKDWNLELLFG
jgi:hypothetical protein